MASNAQQKAETVLTFWRKLARSEEYINVLARASDKSAIGEAKIGRDSTQSRARKYFLDFFPKEEPQEEQDWLIRINLIKSFHKLFELPWNLSTGKEGLVGDIVAEMHDDFVTENVSTTKEWNLHGDVEGLWKKGNEVLLSERKTSQKKIFGELTKLPLTELFY